MLNGVFADRQAPTVKGRGFLFMDGLAEDTSVRAKGELPIPYPVCGGVIPDATTQNRFGP